MNESNSFCDWSMQHAPTPIKWFVNLLSFFLSVMLYVFWTMNYINFFELSEHIFKIFLVFHTYKWPGVGQLRSGRRGGEIFRLYPTNLRLDTNVDGFCSEQVFFSTVFIILLHAVTFFGKMYFASISDGYVMRNNCSSV